MGGFLGYFKKVCGITMERICWRGYFIWKVVDNSSYFFGSLQIIFAKRFQEDIFVCWCRY